MQSCGAPTLKPCCPSELRGLLPPVTDPKAGEPAVGPEASLLWKNICDVIIFQMPVAHQQVWDLMMM